MSEKRARKAAAKAKYEQWKAEGRNTKSKRTKLRNQRNKRKTLRTRRHANGPCGNVGCQKCSVTLLFAA